MTATVSTPKRDLGLEQAVGELRARANGLPHGRVILTLCKLEGRVAYHRVDTDHLTEDELRRLMEERPRGWRG